MVCLTISNDDINYGKEGNQVAMCCNYCLNMVKIKVDCNWLLESPHPTIPQTPPQQKNTLLWSVWTAASSWMCASPRTFPELRALHQSIHRVLFLPRHHWELCVLLQDIAAHSEHGWEDHWCLNPLPPGHLPHWQQALWVTPLIHLIDSSVSCHLSLIHQTG